MRRQWLAFGLAFLFAVGTALGIGYWMHQRNDPDPWVWLDAGDSLVVRGSEFSVLSFGRYLGPLPEYTGTPDGAIVVQLVLQQRILEMPEDPTELACELTLHTKDASWSLNLGIAAGLEANYSCDPEPDEDFRTITATWVAPPAVLEEDPWAVVRFHYPRGAFGVRP